MVRHTDMNRVMDMAMSKEVTISVITEVSIELKKRPMSLKLLTEILKFISTLKHIMFFNVMGTNMDIIIMVIITMSMHIKKNLIMVVNTKNILIIVTTIMAIIIMGMHMYITIKNNLIMNINTKNILIVVIITMSMHMYMTIKNNLIMVINTKNILVMVTTIMDMYLYIIIQDIIMDITIFKIIPINTEMNLNTVIVLK
ncbi:hypothetical protein CDAR_34891 [Caerostris darwini]|uniref:NADH dehydrogenase subunit 6 n=1 Tax=Caerostris darwini TaxID=1538125 RepID=A0AAV4TBW4_9ARAC|nr:hypothetical protein CDAR_34891 [Caerostris darwini]